MKKVLLIFSAILFFSCGKSDELSPVITVTSPTENQVFSGGQTVSVNATITDNEGIHTVHISVIDNSTSGHLVHLEEHFDGKTYNLNKTFPVQTGRSYHIEIGAHDHANNTTTKELTVSAN
jgi:hypothetical protein